MEHLPIWYIGEIETDLCDKATKEYLQIESKPATMGKDGKSIDSSTRNTKIRFADKSHWFGFELLNFGNYANKICNWNWETNLFETVQFAEYGIDQKYYWHVDNFPLHGGNTDRKITVVCLMNDPSEFEGGLLQLRLYNEYTPELKKGTVIAFPSVIEHQVTPVTKGVRYSATMWISGPRFK